MKEITDRLEQGILGLYESDRYADYLRTMSKFHDYSLNNTILFKNTDTGRTVTLEYTNQHFRRLKNMYCGMIRRISAWWKYGFLNNGLKKRFPGISHHRKPFFKLIFIYTVC